MYNCYHRKFRIALWKQYAVYWPKRLYQNNRHSGSVLWPEATGLCQYLDKGDDLRKITSVFKQTEVQSNYKTIKSEYFMVTANEQS